MKRTFKLIMLCALIACKAIAQIPTNGLVGYWSFNGNANDASGNGNNGIVTGATLTNDRFGNPNSAYSFNGTSDYITSAFAPFTAPPFTISAWVKLNQLGAGIEPIVSIGEVGGNQLKRLFFSPTYSGAGLPNIGTGGANGINSTQSSIVANNWVHVVVACSSYTVSGVIFYINGIGYTQNTIGGSNVPVPMNNSPFTFGRHTVNLGVAFFDGLIDDVAMYNRVLTPNEVTFLFSPCTGVPVSTISAIGNQTFCQGSNVLLNVNETYLTYQWQKNNVNINGATSKTYTSNTGGNYRCIVSNSCGIDTSNVINLSILPNVANTVLVTGNTSFCVGDSVTLNSSNTTAGYTYQWYRNNVSINGATSNTFIGKNPGTYKVVSKNTANGCSRISSNSAVVAVTCRLANRDAFVGNVEPIKDFTIYPNPNEGSFTLEINDENVEDGTAIYQVMNINGQMIYNGAATLTNGVLKQEINLEKNFSKGLYLVKVQINGTQMTEKVMLQ